MLKEVATLLVEVVPYLNPAALIANVVYGVISSAVIWLVLKCLWTFWRQLKALWRWLGAWRLTTRRVACGMVFILHRIQVD